MIHCIRNLELHGLLKLLKKTQITLQNQQLIFPRKILKIYDLLSYLFPI